MQNAPRGAFCNTFDLKLPFVIKTLVLNIFKWPLKTGFTVQELKDLKCLESFFPVFLLYIIWIFRNTIKALYYLDIIRVLEACYRAGNMCYTFVFGFSHFPILLIILIRKPLCGLINNHTHFSKLYYCLCSSFSG